MQAVGEGGEADRGREKCRDSEKGGCRLPVLCALGLQESPKCCLVPYIARDQIVCERIGSRVRQCLCEHI